ncbi:sterol regulatory element binding protein cleavage-activating protein [Obba rivulosa]|uniref:Sterol regulatory element-binding protein cleavage-activating protein n=1 Tax=Obba rivulosa TaxID=1052685 RepID=A0A8E2DKP7_9APHY|nr:sterol regulatory element binding protein cleavage-activating protein [Obba rivulosa]
MSMHPRVLLQRARTFGTRFFHRFGIHCATHQIRLILVSSVVITSLLFPAIAIYSSPQTQFFAGFTLRVLDSILTPDDISSYFAQHDLRHLWEGHKTIRVREDSDARLSCGRGGLLRSERVLISSVSPDEGLGALDRGTLVTTLRLQQRISETLQSSGIPCVTTADGTCFSLGPAAFWNYEEDALATDTDILDTLNLSYNVTVSGIPISAEMVLAGRELSGPSSSYIDAAMFLVLTYFFPDTDCMGNAGHFQWLQALEEAAGYSSNLIVQVQTPRLIALEYQKADTNRRHFSILSVFSYIAYTAFFVYCFRSMRRMKMVHSRIGLAFTGLVEIVVSTLTSMSVCALVGFRVTMVPWELLPIVVLFIGVENMFNIVDAVVRTSISLPVKERIAVGLSHAGTSNTLRVVSYNTVLGVIAGFSTGAIRQFCAFSIVVLVAHWFLVHTFFVTVVSIDIQRLELDELLTQNASLAPAVAAQLADRTGKPTSKWGRFIATSKSVLAGRPARNISLFLLLAITATLYFATYPDSARTTDVPKITLPRPPSHANRLAAPDKTSPAARIWHILNPSDESRVHIRVESPTILVLSSEDELGLHQKLGLDSEKLPRSRWPRMSRLWTRTVRPVVWLLKIMIVPITTTTVLLYGLLLYLLKDAELLEAQRNRPEPESPVSDEPPPVEANISFGTLPRAFATDVDLIAASKDGRVVAAVGLQNEFVLWRRDTQVHTIMDTSDILLGSPSAPAPATTLTAIAINDEGTLCAAGTSTGMIGLWRIDGIQAKAMPHLSLDSVSAITDLFFASKSQQHSRSSSRDSSSRSSSFERSPQSDGLGCLYATLENGGAAKLNLDASADTRVFMKPTRTASVVKSTLIPVQNDGRLLLGFILDDGMLELCDIGGLHDLLSRDCLIAAGNPCDFVHRVHACNVELDGASRLIVGAATQAGVISLWDAQTRECLHIMGEPYGDINQLRITPVYTSICAMCGELPVESFLIMFSVGQVLLCHRAYLTLPTRRCSCPRNQPQQVPRSSLLGMRSRSGSVSSLASTPGTTTPVHTRPRMPSISSGTAFPVSAHGVHSRRASDSASARRSHDSLLATSEYDEYESHPVGPQAVTPVTSFLSSGTETSIWQSLVVVRVMETAFERGSWDAVDDRVVGIRRRPRPSPSRGAGDPKQARFESLRGLPASAMERWELWTFEPAESRTQGYALTVLHREVRNPRKNEPRRRSDLIPRLHFTRVAPLVGYRSFCLAGFGNTVGVFFLRDDSSRRRTYPWAENTRISSIAD